jgi:hypothetical protein
VKQIARATTRYPLACSAPLRRSAYMTGMATTDTATLMIKFSVIAEPIANDSAKTISSRVVSVEVVISLRFP